ncbi:MAG: murein biosynthesis integral membrane protein MurJ [Micavibrio aeruginosavorus]|uniref:Probable lipid II flippase MurJ n=1 Tax=Micavibrio aeruginosavorus TaxID=349221 RepID=A0A7T5UH94_9BACT|nr:MAG: murein biosynthesis integral membrane protein MurJ [Micavibrio aeruginosavorus]
MKLIKAMATVGGLTGLSRVVGFVRDVMTAYFLGAGPVADAFVVALKLPNFFRHVTAEGAFSVSFVPLYSETLQREGEEAAGKFAGQAFMTMLAVLIAFTMIMLAAMPWAIGLIAPGFDEGSVSRELAVEMSRVTFPYLLLMSLAALVGGMLNAHDRFGPFAAASVFFNLCQIGFMLIADQFETVGHALSWAVSISGVIQLCWLLAYLRKYKIRLPLIRPHMDGKVRKLFKLMGPGVLGAGIIHVNLFADIMIASFLSAGAISAIYYADRLFQLPLGVVGIAVGTALLPMLTKSLAAGNKEEARDLFNRALEYCLFFTMPAAVALMLATHDIISVLFERGAFSAADTARAAPALACLSIGLPAYVGVKIFSSAYWSQQDTKTPVKIAAVMAIVNIGVALILTPFLDVAGITLATGLAGWVQCYFLWKGLKGQDTTSFDKRLLRTVPRIFLCSCVMGGGLLLMLWALRPWFDGAFGHQALALSVLVAGGVVIYFSAAHVCGVLRFNDLKKYFARRRKPSALEALEAVDGE